MYTCDKNAISWAYYKDAKCNEWDQSEGGPHLIMLQDGHAKCESLKLGDMHATFKQAGWTYKDSGNY